MSKLFQSVIFLQYDLSPWVALVDWMGLFHINIWWLMRIIQVSLNLVLGGRCRNTICKWRVSLQSLNGSSYLTLILSDGMFNLTKHLNYFYINSWRKIEHDFFKNKNHRKLLQCLKLLSTNTTFSKQFSVNYFFGFYFKLNTV